MNNFISLNKVSKSFSNYKRINVLKKIKYSFKKGKIYSLMGPSGSGKSTLLNILSMIDKPTSGSLLIDDTADSDATNTGGTQPKSNLVRNTAKPEINMDNIEQAKKFLASGGSIETLHEKYTISPTMLKILKNG